PGARLDQRGGKGHHLCHDRHAPRCAGGGRPQPVPGGPRRGGTNDEPGRGCRSGGAAGGRQGSGEAAAGRGRQLGGVRTDGGRRMISSVLRGATAVVGVGHAGLGAAHGYAEIEILAQAARQAVADAGLRMSDIDGLCTCSAAATMWAMPVAEYLGIRPSFIDSTMLGGSSFVAHLGPAMHALQAGECNAVLVCYGSTQRTSAMNRAAVGKMRQMLDPQPYETPYEPMQPISAYALATSRHMAEYGTTREQLAEVAV